MHTTAAAQTPASARSFIRFTASSLFSAGVDLAAFSLLEHLLAFLANDNLEILLATCLARALSALVNHLINYILVFHSQASRARATGLYAIITVCKTLCSALLVAKIALFLPALPQVGIKAVVDTLLFFFNYLLQKAFVY